MFTRETASAAGKKGAATVKERYGAPHFQRLGKAGGAVMAQRGSEYFRAMGRQGAAKRWGCAEEASE